MNWQLLYWPLACLLMASAQGLLLPAIKRTPPGAEAKRQSLALHVLLTVVYFLPLALVRTVPNEPVWALASRLLLFDPAINLASGAPVFAVGSTALTDRLLRRLAPGHPERLRLVGWLLSVGAACSLLLVNWK